MGIVSLIGTELGMPRGIYPRKRKHEMETPKSPLVRTEKLPVIHVMMYGKKAIGAFYSKKNAEAALVLLKRILPAAYNVSPYIIEVEIQG